MRERLDACAMGPSINPSRNRHRCGSFELRSHGVDGTITWVGAHQWPRVHPRGAPVVRFDRFCPVDAEGEKLLDFAAALAPYFVGRHRRAFFKNGVYMDIQHDIDRILKLAKPQIGSRRRMGTMKGSMDCRSGCVPFRARQWRPVRHTRLDAATHIAGADASSSLRSQP